MKSSTSYTMSCVRYSTNCRSRSTYPHRHRSQTYASRTACLQQLVLSGKCSHLVLEAGCLRVPKQFCLPHLQGHPTPSLYSSSSCRAVWSSACTWTLMKSTHPMHRTTGRCMTTYQADPHLNLSQHMKLTVQESIDLLKSQPSQLVSSSILLSTKMFALCRSLFHRMDALYTEPCRPS